MSTLNWILLWAVVRAVEVRQIPGSIVLWGADLAHTTTSSLQQSPSMNTVVGIHPSWEPQGRSWSQFLSCGTLHRTRQTCMYLLLRHWKADIAFATFQEADGYLALPRWEGFLWLCSLPRMVIVLGGMLVTLFLRVYKYSLAGAGSLHKMATHASLPPAFPSLLTSLPAQQIPIINPSLWKPGVIQIHLLQCLIHPLLQDTGFRVFYEMHFTAFIIQDILQHFMAAFYKILSNIM